MPLIQIVVALIVAGVLLWLMNSFIPMGGNIKKLLNWVVGIAIAGGPKGRDASATTDAWMRAEILSYSRSRGLFAGISLEGTTLRPDDDASADVYGHPIKAKDIVRGNGTRVTTSGHGLVNALQKSAPNNESEQAANR
jgi:lipid-binding SYLF domain-containing protein